MKPGIRLVGTFALAFSLLLPPLASAARAKIAKRVAEPYVGTITVNPADGDVLFSDHPDALCYPASIVKLLMLLIIQEKIEQGALHASDQVTVTAPAARTGGSQVYLKEHEVFSIEDLLYALVVQSANDAAVALAIHVAGSPPEFVRLMQEKATALGMKNTKVHSVHGLPPETGQEPDVSTPADLAVLARELLKHPDILRYTSTKVRGFRNNSFEMRNHNKLLSTFPGCDGFKTGYFNNGGFSIVATAERRGVRLVSVVAGSKSKKVRDTRAQELLARAFSSLPLPAATALSAAAPGPLPATTAVAGDDAPPPASSLPGAGGFGRALKIGLYALIIVAAAAFFFWIGRISRP